MRGVVERYNIPVVGAIEMEDRHVLGDQTAEARFRIVCNGVTIGWAPAIYPGRQVIIKYVSTVLREKKEEMDKRSDGIQRLLERLRLVRKRRTGPENISQLSQFLER